MRLPLLALEQPALQQLAGDFPMGIPAKPPPPPADEQEVLTFPEAASWLRISDRTLAGRLDEYPHFRVGKQIRFLKSELRRAAKERSVNQ